MKNQVQCILCFWVDHLFNQILNTVLTPWDKFSYNLNEKNNILKIPKMPNCLDFLLFNRSFCKCFISPRIKEKDKFVDFICFLIYPLKLLEVQRLFIFCYWISNKGKEIESNQSSIWSLPWQFHIFLTVSQMIINGPISLILVTAT